MLAAKPACRHCGTPVPDGAADDAFCCAGCAAVFALLAEQGLGRYYELAGEKIAPAPEPASERSFGWLDPVVATAEAAPGEVCALSLDVQGVHCAACVWLMSELFRRAGGGVSITVNPALGKVRLAYGRGSFAVRRFLEQVERFGYLFGPDRKRAARASRDLPARIGVCAAITMNVMLFSISFYFGLAPQGPSGDGALFQLFSRLSWALSAIVVLVGGWPFFAASLRALRRGVLHLDLPIAVGILLAFGASFYQARAGRGDRAYFDTLNVFVTLMLVGRWLQERVIERNRRLLLEDDGGEGLTVRRRKGDRAETIAAARVREGDELLLAPGDLVPADAVVLGRPAAFATDWITGEPGARSFAVGERVPAGATLSGRAAATVRAIGSFADSPLPALLRSPDGDARPSHARFWDRYARIYVIAVLAIAASAALLWWRLDPSRVLDVTVAVLVVTCPCAVGIAAPLAHELVQARLRRAGLFARDPALLDALPRVRTILFDKTGTLTLNRLELANPSSVIALAPALRDAAYDMAARSSHPVARCLEAALARTGARLDPDAHVEEIAGRGLLMTRDGRALFLGRPDGGARDETVLTVDGAEAARFRLAERARPDAAREIAALANSGYDLWLVSGDAPARVAALADALHVPRDRALSAQRPEDKAAVVRSVDHRDTLFLGDGINDSLAFQAAFTSGSASGARPAMAGRAGFFLLGEGLAPVRLALELSRDLRRVVRENLALAVAYNLLAVVACFAGSMTPLRAALAMPASSLTLIALTTFRLGRPRAAAAPTARRELAHPEVQWTS